MSVTHTITRAYARNGETLSGAVATAADGEQNLDVTVPANQTNLEVDVAIDVSTMKSLFIYADKAVTIKTNSTSVPDNTIALRATSPLTWASSDGYYANPLTVDVTKLYLTNTTATVLKIRILVDATP